MFDCFWNKILDFYSFSAISTTHPIRPCPVWASRRCCFLAECRNRQGIQEGKGIALQAAYCSCSGAVRHRQSRRTAKAAAQTRAHVLWPAAIQPFNGILPVIRVNEWMNEWMKVNFSIAYCYEIIFQYAIVTDRAGVQPICCRLGPRTRAQACG